MACPCSGNCKGEETKSAGSLTFDTFPVEDCEVPEDESAYQEIDIYSNRGGRTKIRFEVQSQKGQVDIFGQPQDPIDIQGYSTGVNYRFRLSQSVGAGQRFDRLEIMASVYQKPAGKWTELCVLRPRRSLE